MSITGATGIRGTTGKIGICIPNSQIESSDSEIKIENSKIIIKRPGKPDIELIETIERLKEELKECSFLITNLFIKTKYQKKKIKILNKKIKKLKKRK